MKKEYIESPAIDVQLEQRNTKRQPVRKRFERPEVQLRGTLDAMTGDNGFWSPP